MSKIDKALKTIGEWVVGMVAIIVLMLFGVIGLLFIHPVGWVILILGVCKMFGVI